MRVCIQRTWMVPLVVGLVAAPLAMAQSSAQAKPEVAKAAPAEIPADSVTEGSVSVGGQTINYRAVAGTLTVGSSDEQDAMIGLDGKYLPDATVDQNSKPQDQPATARMFYVAYFEKSSYLLDATNPKI